MKSSPFVHVSNHDLPGVAESEAVDGSLRLLAKLIANGIRRKHEDRAIVEKTGVIIPE